MYISVSLLLISWVTSGEGKCGYESCNPVKDGMLNVHLVPHTHDDVGWLKTVDQYYYGSHNDIQNAGVQYILDSVIQELLKDPAKRFIYVEIAFFARWYREQSDSLRHQVKGLVNNGRLEFILGGWCMNDEASTHYNAIIDQHTVGFEFLQNNFGECGRPRIGWQVDPFGHSREQASLFAQFGFDGLYFGRLDYQDKDVRAASKTMEMVWKGSPKNLGSVADLFTGVLYTGYGPPGGFCWDIECSDEPVMDDDRLHDNNVKERVTDFLKAVIDQASHYDTNHIMLTMGSDFQYQYAHHWYKNLDKLIKYVNALQSNGSNINLLYSTPSCYTLNVNKANKTWTTKDDDFFPYAHQEHSFWTGYFTSRAALKGYARTANNFLQVCKQMDALARLGVMDNSTSKIEIFKEALGVAQHHDAVSGTEKQAVAYDYAERIANGINECEKVVNDAYKRLLPMSTDQPPPQVFCSLRNISMCALTEQSKQFQVTIYNPVGRTVSAWVRVPVVGNSFTVMAPAGTPIASQIVPVSNETKRIPERKGSLAQNDLVFQAKVPALGYSTYFVNMNSNWQSGWRERTYRMEVTDDTVLKNQFLSLTFDGSSGKLKQMVNLESGISLPIQQDFYYYTGHPGNNSKPDLQASGAYVFRPSNNNPNLTSVQMKIQSYYSQGQLVQEMLQIFSPWVSQVVRLYEGERYAEFEWTVGPIPIKNEEGKEVISRFSTGMKTEKMYYTDANGREIQERIRDYRKTWKLNQTEEVAGNYYPVNSRIYIQDKSQEVQFTVLTDRSQGGASIQDGDLELMVHRRLLYDDSLGVGEPLNETGSDGQGLIVRGKHYVFLDKIEKSAALHRDMALKLYMAPSASFSNSSMKPSDWISKFHVNWSGLNKELPANVHLLTLEQMADSKDFLLRMEHIYEKNEDPVLSQPVTVSLQNLFEPFTIQSMTELTLGANLPLSQLHRLQWKTADSSRLMFKSHSFRHNDAVNVTLNPMEIHTFQVTLS